MRKETFEYIKDNDEIVIMSKDQYERFTDMECECDDFIYVQKTDCTDKMWENLQEFMSKEAKDFDIKVTLKLVPSDARVPLSKTYMMHIRTREDLEHMGALTNEHANRHNRTAFVVYTIDFISFDVSDICHTPDVGDVISERIKLYVGC